MKSREFLSAHKSRCTEAFEELLPSWKPTPELSGPQCPHCEGLDIAPAGWTDNRQKRRYQCRSCKRKFTDQPQAHVCRCEVPGQQLSCQECPEFKQFMERVNQRMAEV